MKENWNFEVDELLEVSIILSQISSTKWGGSQPQKPCVFHSTLSFSIIISISKFEKRKITQK